MIIGEIPGALRRRPLVALVVLAAAGFALAGCSAPEPPRSGTVVDTSYLPERESIEFVCEERRQMGCANPESQTVLVPETWSIEVELSADDVAVVELPEDEWSTIEVGDAFTLDDEQFERYLSER